MFNLLKDFLAGVLNLLGIIPVVVEWLEGLLMASIWYVAWKIDGARVDVTVYHRPAPI